jgi:hypothetical protein
VTSFPSKETDNMDGTYDLPTLDRLGGLSPIFEHWTLKRNSVDTSGGKVYFPQVNNKAVVVKFLL